jgi:hypothetical protein
MAKNKRKRKKQLRDDQMPQEETTKLWVAEGIEDALKEGWIEEVTRDGVKRYRLTQKGREYAEKEMGIKVKK